MALYGDLVRGLVAGGMFVVLWVFFSLYAVLARKMVNTLYMNDFGKFYYSTRAFLLGADMYGPTEATAIPVGNTTAHLWNMNPPHFHLLILPLAILSPGVALVVWSIANLAALLGSIHLIAQEMRWRWTLTRVLWTAFGVIVCSATGIIVVTGQLTFLLMLPMTLAWRHARNNRWNRAALYLGIAAGVKPFLGVFGMYLLLARRFRAAWAMALAGILSVMAGVVVFGWNAYVSWAKVLRRVDWGWAPMNASIEGVLARVLSPNPVFAPLFTMPALVTPIAGVLAITICLVSLIVLVRDQSNQRADRVFAGLIFAALLASPLGWMYYLWLAAGPVAGLCATLGNRLSRVRDMAIVAAVPGLLLPIYMTTLWAQYPLGSITMGSLYAWTILALWAAVILDARAPQVHAAA